MRLLFLVALLTFVAGCSGPRPEPASKPGWWTTLTDSPSIPSEDSLTLERYAPVVAAQVPLDDSWHMRLYGEDFVAPEPLYLLGHKRTATGVAALVYRQSTEADHPSPRVEYIALDTAGRAGAPVLIAYQDNMVIAHRVSSIFRSRYGLQQVDVRSSEWAVEDTLGLPDTLFTTVRTLQARPNGELPDTLRVEQVWRIR